MVPSTMSRSQEVTSPKREIPCPIIRVRRSTSLPREPADPWLDCCGDPGACAASAARRGGSAGLDGTFVPGGRSFMEHRDHLPALPYYHAPPSSDLGSQSRWILPF